MKTRLFPLLGILFVLTHLSAQTDVTSQYLTNADFEGSYEVQSYPRNDGDNARAIYKPEGWTLTYTNGESNDMTSLNSSCLQWNNFSSRPQPADGGNNVYWIRFRWGSSVSIKLSQTVSLPAGMYRLSADAFWIESSSAATISAGDRSVTIASRDAWANYAVSFTLTVPAEVEIAYTFTQNAQAECISGVDNFKLEKYAEGDLDMTSMVSNETDAWTNPQGAPNHGTASANSVTMPERWFSWIPTGEIMSQSVDLPDGIYEAQVYCHGHVAWVDSPVTTSGATGYTTLSVNGKKVDIPVILNTGWEADEPRLYTLSDIPVVDGKMTFRLTANKAGANWFTINVKSLTCLGSLPSLRYTIGDVNEDDDVTIADVTSLVNIILGKTTDYREELADVNEDGDVTIADVTSLVNIILGKQEAKVVDQTWTYADLAATVYAEQSATENAGGAGYALNSAICILTHEDVSDKYDIADYLTTLRITTTLSNVKSVSVYAKGKESIAGLMNYQTAYESATYSAGDSPSVYASDDQSNRNMQSDVVTVTGTNAGTYVAYLLPIDLPNGVIVTIRDSNGKYYSQDFSVTAGAVNNLTFTATAATNNWMATIPGNINFSMLSTPGAHNAATSSVSSSYANQAKCQSETIAQQLANGVRAFDLRPQYKSNSTITADNLTIYHGTVSTGVLYKDAIATIASFLDAHPSEAISIIMAKEEGSGTDQTSTLISVVTEIHNTYSSYFKVLDHSYYTLDDFRGKIFYGCRPNWYNVTGAVRVENWPDDSSVTDYSVAVGSTCSASVEDAYNTSGDSKKSVVNAMLNLASANEDRSHFHFTYTSVAWKLLGSAISTHANTQNPAAATYITNTLTGPAGYVYADFMGSSSYSGQTLLKAVIDQNYKYVFKGRSRIE